VRTCKRIIYLEIIDKTNNIDTIYWTKDDYGGVNTPLNPYSVSWYGFGRDDNGSLCFYEIKSPENSLYVKRRCVDRVRNNWYATIVIFYFRNYRVKRGLYFRRSF
jgi:hypothetical protein